MVGMQERQRVGGQKSSPFHPSLTLSHPHFSINTIMVFMAKEEERERTLVERSRNLVLKIHLKQNSPLQSFKALEG